MVNASHVFNVPRPCRMSVALAHELLASFVLASIQHSPCKDLAKYTISAIPELYLPDPIHHSRHGDCANDRASHQAAKADEGARG